MCADSITVLLIRELCEVHTGNLRRRNRGGLQSSSGYVSSDDINLNNSACRVASAISWLRTEIYMWNMCTSYFYSLIVNFH